MNQNSYILAIESSCDDTSIAIATTDYDIIYEMTSSQTDHEKYGGVLPELASRLHMQNILHLIEIVIKESKINPDELAAVAVSVNPGLIGSLLVGLSFAKSFAWSMGIPLITVNHMLGHVFANYLEHTGIRAPYLALVVSGGHTELIRFDSDTEFSHIGKTLDDAAGETFDKTAKLLKLGYPGGPHIDKLAKEGNPDFVAFPRALKQKDNYNFSYSGLKTSVLQYLADKPADWIELHKSDLAASVQIAIIEPLVNKTIRCAKLNNIKQILIGGGVAANSLLRSMMTKKASLIGVEVIYPSIKLCMDNASMVAAAAIPKFKSGLFSTLSINAFSDKGTRLL